jgi:hypothetical protein
MTGRQRARIFIIRTPDRFARIDRPEFMCALEEAAKGARGGRDGGSFAIA